MLIISLDSAVIELLAVFVIFFKKISHQTYPRPVLPLGGRKWQLIKVYWDWREESTQFGLISYQFLSPGANVIKLFTAVSYDFT